MGVQDFLGQIPSGLLVMVCGSGILLILMWGFILYRRSQRSSTAPLPTIPEPQAPVSIPAEEGPGILAQAGQAVRNFFFYTEEEKAQLQTASAAPASGTADPAPLPQVTAPPEAAEVMHIWRDVVDGTLIIQIGQSTYRTMGDIAAGGQERRFLSVLRELARLAKETVNETSQPLPTPPAVQLAGEDAPPPPPPPEPLPESQPATPPPPADPIPAEDGSAFPSYTPPPVQPASTPGASGSRPEEEDPESLGTFFGNVGKAFRSGGKVPPVQMPEPSSIPDQIEAILQERLRYTEDFAGREIHVKPSVSGGVTIEVDGRFYEAVSDIEDAHVREFVQGAIQEWEERS